jgi:hypothetical protein
VLGGLVSSTPVLKSFGEMPQWNKTVVDRAGQLGTWVDFCDQTTKRGVTIYAYANNHYAGFGPATVELFRNLWCAKGLPDVGRPQRKPKESLLFDL